MKGFVETVATAVVASVSLGAMVSCSGYGRDVREALRYAGDNRPELEKVIAHYSRNECDTLKLKAALYLIGNMTYHRSYPAEQYGRYCREVDSLCTSGMEKYACLEAIEKVSSGYKPFLDPEYDVRKITADYLIWNIDDSFEQWKNLDYLQHLGFNDFCEYVLPYKCIEFQPLTKWKEEYRDIYRGELDMLYPISEYRHNSRMAAEAVQAQLKDSVIMERLDVNCIDILDIRSLSHMRFGDCFERSVLGLMNSRSKGIPVTMDFTPSWADRGASHHWNNVLTPRRRNIDFEPFRFRPGDFHYTDNPYAKVYRCTYSPDPLLLEALKREHFLPSSLMPIFIKDVTDEYSKVSDIVIEVDKKGVSSDYAYLCVFNDYEWVPVDISRVRHGKASFENVGVGLVYLAAMYREGGQVPVSLPFLLDTRGKIKHIGIDGGYADMRIVRKYPSFQHIYAVKQYLRQGRIEAADNPGFRNPRAMAEFPDWGTLSGEESISDTTSFRYWRLVCSHDSSSDFGELYFYDRYSGNRVKGSFVTPGMPVRNHVYDTPERICDDDPLTYFAVVSKDRWVGFDFGRPVSMGEVAYIRRGDGNDICPGQHYELYYWDDGKWRFHGEQTAERVWLDFHDVPSGGLYYLKCTTSGTQQRIFMYENGEQVWY